MHNLKYIWFIAQKDLKIFVKDRAAVFFFIIFPFLFMALFYFLNIGAVEDTRLELHMVTRESHGGLSHQILGAMETLDESQLGPGAPKIIWEDDYNQARQAVEDGELAGFIAFPADFTQALMTDSPTELEVFVDASNSNDRAALNGLARAISSQIGTHLVIINATVELLVENKVIPADVNSIKAAVEEIMEGISLVGTTGSGTYVEFKVDPAGEVEAENPANFVISGYLVMFVFFAAALSAETIVRERQNHTLERLLTSSVTKESILGGIFAGTAFRGLIQIIIFWIVGILVFKVDMGLSPAAVVILSILMVVMSSAFAVMLATLAKTQRSASSLAVITALVLAPLGGCWWPIFLYPHWLQMITKVTPHAWANTGFNKLMLFGADFAAVAPEMLALLVFSVIFGVIAIFRFRTSAI